MFILYKVTENMAGRRFGETKSWSKIIFALDQLPRKIQFGRWGVVIASILLITLIRFLLDPFIGNRIPLALYAFSIIIAGWYVGFTGSMIVIFATLFIGDFLFVVPKYSLGLLSRADEVLAVVYILIGIFFTILSMIARQFVIETQKLSLAEKKARLYGQRALEYRDNFLSFASHELKTPLTSALIHLQILEKKLKQNSTNTYDADVNKIKSQVEKIRLLTNQLLSVSNISNGFIRLEYSKFDLLECINEAIDLAHLINTQHKVEIIGSKNIKIHADREKICQCLINLISNAMIYSPDHKKINVHLTIKKRQIIISIEDFGIGIPKSEQGKIFKRFYKPKESHTFPGIGIGLYFVQEIIKRHKGKIWIVSEEKKGSKFSIKLPR